MKTIVRELKRSDLAAAMALVWEVFSKYEAPTFSDEGIRQFRDYIEVDAIAGEMRKGSLILWGSFLGEELTGVIALRPPAHISLLFVAEAHHRKGFAKALFSRALSHSEATGESHMSVNSSHYAAEVYRRFGFADTDLPQTVDGIRFIPMKRQLDKNAPAR